MSLPFLLTKQCDGVPNQTPYLQAPANVVETWKRRVAPAGLCVGVVWAGNVSNTNDAQQSIPLEKNAKAFRSAGRPLRQSSEDHQAGGATALERPGRAPWRSAQVDVGGSPQVEEH
jgi:hypothetical protein